MTGAIGGPVAEPIGESGWRIRQAMLSGEAGHA